jgi:hypothetical protein
MKRGVVGKKLGPQKAFHGKVPASVKYMTQRKSSPVPP